MSLHNRSLGCEGEGLAVTYLERHNYKILQRNFRCRSGEIDIVARDGKTTVFVEVKTRKADSMGLPSFP